MQMSVRQSDRLTLNCQWHHEIYIERKENGSIYEINCFDAASNRIHFQIKHLDELKPFIQKALKRDTKTTIAKQRVQVIYLNSEVLFIVKSNRSKCFAEKFDKEQFRLFLNQILVWE